MKRGEIDFLTRMFINEQDLPRNIENPDQPFHYWISTNDRYVERHKEAFTGILYAESLIYRIC